MLSKTVRYRGHGTHPFTDHLQNDVLENTMSTKLSLLRPVKMTTTCAQIM